MKTKKKIIAILTSGALLLLAGCSKPNNESGFNTDTGKHVNNWYVDHRDAYLKNPTVCADCHGTDLKSGISKVSCFSADFSGMTCHANGPSGHPAGWAGPDSHGATAKGAPGITSGFSLCQTCHGSDFVGGLVQKTCLNTAGCHGSNVNAPHSPKPWRGSVRTHTNTDPGNAPVCANCHTNGANSSVKPSPFASGTAPGCFNNTLCHAAVGHPAGWANPDSHGATAKAAPSTTAGFSLCQTCHGSDFTGGAALQTCLNTAGCHGASVSAPHSPKPWRGGTRTHTNTDTNNAAVCATCHTNGANSSVQPSPPAPAGTTPNCFNNTLCHGAVSGHPAGWALPAAHGATAKAAPSTTSGFSLCQYCHGNDFTGGTALQTCLNTAGCHGASVSAPHSPKPWRGGTRTHTNTDTNNAAVCATCHTNGANSSVQPSPPAPAGTTPNCFNNTLCHANVGHPAGWALPTAHGATAKAAPSTTSGFSLCQYCHGNDFTGGTALQTCLNTGSCHGANVNAPHAALWLPGDTYTHATTDPGNAPVCGLCHLGNRTPPSYVPVPSGTNPNCFNNTLCHAEPACGSCHAIPPNGTTAPNQDGSHTRLMPDGLVAGHNALPNVTGVCATCHTGAGSGTALHQNGVADVIFDPKYNAKSGPASYDPASVTCSNVSCHGGQTTPSWLTGAINVNTQCGACHISGSTQYNSYNSGHHSTHLGSDVGAVCTDCHDTTKLSTVHFNDLNTTTMSNAYKTILSTLNYTGTAAGTGTCTLTCHGETHSVRQW